MHFLIVYFAGALLCNAVPHLVASLSGHAFPTPFGKPSGVGLSSPLVNFGWGVTNLLGGTALLIWHPPQFRPPHAEAAVFFLGVIATGGYLTTHFGRVQKAHETPSR